MKPLWIGVGAVVVIAVIAGVMMRGGNKGATPSGSPAASSSAAPTTSAAATSGSLKDLLALGGAQTCTFSDASGSSTGSGTFYVNSGNVRGDFSTVTEGKTTLMHIIVKDQTSYMWGDALPTGVKMSLSALTQASASPAPQAKSLDVNQNVNYSCSPWVVDASLFTLPAGVQFTDLNAAIQGNIQAPTGASGTAAQCAQCDQAGSAKAQCRAALGCK